MSIRLKIGYCNWNIANLELNKYVCYTLLQLGHISVIKNYYYYYLVRPVNVTE